MTVAELLSDLGRAMPWDKAAGWDPVGLQVGDPQAMVGQVAVCYEVTGPVLEALVAAPPTLAIAYHPLLFRPTTRFVVGPGAEGRAARLAAAGISLAVVHTAFDVARGGAADALAGALGLDDTAGFGPLWGGDSRKIVTFVPGASADLVAKAMAGAGAGRIGNYSNCAFRSAGVGTFFPEAGAAPASGSPGTLNAEDEVRIEMNTPAHLLDAVVAALVAAHPYEEPAFDVYPRSGDAGLVGRIGRFPGSTVEELVERVTVALGSAVRVTAVGNQPVGRVAVLPGSGADFLDAAVDAGADAVVTGDVTHHPARRAQERRLVVVDPGHAATERPGLERLYAAVGALTEVVDLRRLDPDPWK